MRKVRYNIMDLGDLPTKRLRRSGPGTEILLTPRQAGKWRKWSLLSCGLFPQARMGEYICIDPKKLRRKAQARKVMNRKKILSAMADAEQKAWKALAGYKFWMFGYHAARWVNYKKLLDSSTSNPFVELVKVARKKTEEGER